MLLLTCSPALALFVVMDFAGRDDEPRAVLINGTDLIVAGTSRWKNISADIVFEALMPNGTVIKSFGCNGRYFLKKNAHLEHLLQVDLDVNDPRRLIIVQGELPSDNDQLWLRFVCPNGEKDCPEESFLLSLQSQFISSSKAAGDTSIFRVFLFHQSLLILARERGGPEDGFLKTHVVRFDYSPKGRAEDHWKELSSCSANLPGSFKVGDVQLLNQSLYIGGSVNGEFTIVGCNWINGQPLSDFGEQGVARMSIADRPERLDLLLPSDDGQSFYALGQLYFSPDRQSLAVLNFGTSGNINEAFGDQGWLLISLSGDCSISNAIPEDSQLVVIVNCRNKNGAVSPRAFNISQGGEIYQYNFSTDLAVMGGSDVKQLSVEARILQKNPGGGYVISGTFHQPDFDPYIGLNIFISELFWDERWKGGSEIADFHQDNKIHGVIPRESWLKVFQEPEKYLPPPVEFCVTTHTNRNCFSLPFNNSMLFYYCEKMTKAFSRYNSALSGSLFFWEIVTMGEARRDALCKAWVSENVDSWLPDINRATPSVLNYTIRPLLVDDLSTQWTTGVAGGGDRPDESDRGEGSPDAQETALIVGGTVAGVLSIAALIGLVLYCRNKPDAELGAAGTAAEMIPLN